MTKVDTSTFSPLAALTTPMSALHSCSENAGYALTRANEAVSCNATSRSPVDEGTPFSGKIRQLDRRSLKYLVLVSTNARRVPA